MSQVVTKVDTRRIKRKRESDGYAPSKKYKMVGRPQRSLQLKYHKFTRACTFGNAYVVNLDTRTGFGLNGVSTGLFNMQFNFTLAGVNSSFGGGTATVLALPNYTEFTNLYDQYRIDWVECEFYFSNNNSSNNSPGSTLPIMYLCKDYDDSNVANYPEIQQYATMRTWQLGNQQGKMGKFVMKVKPNVDVALYQGLTTGYSRGKPQFIDTSSPSVPHYGIKIAYDPIFTPASSTNVGYLSVIFKYHLTLAHTK